MGEEFPVTGETAPGGAAGPAAETEGPASVSEIVEYIQKSVG